MHTVPIIDSQIHGASPWSSDWGTPHINKTTEQHMHWYITDRNNYTNSSLLVLSKVFDAMKTHLIFLQTYLHTSQNSKLIWNH